MVKTETTMEFSRMSVILDKITCEDEHMIALASAMKIAKNKPKEDSEDYIDLKFLLHIIHEYTEKTGISSVEIPIDILEEMDVCTSKDFERTEKPDFLTDICRMLSEV